MSDFIDDFLSGLEEDKQKPRTKGDRIQKVLMSSQANQGTVVFAPWINKDDNKFYKVLTGVREYKTTLSLYREGKDAVWVRILPKDFYGELTAAQEELYAEVTGLFDQLDSDLGDTASKGQKLRYRSYSLFDGVLINHVNLKREAINDNVGKAVLLMFPSRGPVNELATAIQAKINSTKGSREWIPAIFSKDDKGREGVMSINFEHPEGVIGYKTQVSFEFNTSYSKYVDPVEGFPEEVTKLLGDPIGSFLGWERGDEGNFSAKLFNELKQVLTVAIKTNGKVPAESTEAAPENKNGKDPMLNGDGAEKKEEAPAEAPAPEAEGKKPEEEIKLPF